MRKFIACFVLLAASSILAYADPGSPDLGTGWVPTGGTPLAWDGAAQTSSDVALSLQTTTNVTLSTSGTNEAIVCVLSGSEGASALTAPSVSGGGLTWIHPVHSFSSTQTTDIFYAWAATAITSQTITASWTTGVVYFFSCRAITGSKDQTSLVAGTDYATGTTGTSPITDVTVTATTIATSGSWLVGVGNHWNSTSVTADSGTTVFASFIPGGGDSAHWFMVSSAALSAGSHTIGATMSGSNRGVAAAMEILLGP